MSQRPLSQLQQGRVSQDSMQWLLLAPQILFVAATRALEIYLCDNPAGFLGVQKWSRVGFQVLVEDRRQRSTVVDQVITQKHGQHYDIRLIRAPKSVEH